MDRRFHRKRLNARFRVQGKELSGELWFESEDISIGGVYLLSDFLMDKGEEIDLILEHSNLENKIEIRARVKWVNLKMEDSQKDRYPGMGLEFIDPDRSVLDALSKLVK